MTEVYELAIIPRDMSQESINQRHSVVLKALHAAEIEAKQLLTAYGAKHTRLRLRNGEPHIFLRRSRAYLHPLRWAFFMDGKPSVLDLNRAASLLSKNQRQELFDAEQRRGELNYMISALSMENKRLQEFERLMNDLPQAANDDTLASNQI